MSSTNSLTCAVSFSVSDFGNEDVKLVYQHFQRNLSGVMPDISAKSVTDEWNLLKKLVARK